LIINLVVAGFFGPPCIYSTRRIAEQTKMRRPLQADACLVSLNWQWSRPYTGDFITLLPIADTACNGSFLPVLLFPPEVTVTFCETPECYMSRPRPTARCIQGQLVFGYAL